jgi:hypothetical protein
MMSDSEKMIETIVEDEEQLTEKTINGKTEENHHCRD